MKLEVETKSTSLPLSANETAEMPIDFALTNVRELLAQGIAAAQSGDRENARTMLERATQIDPRSEDAWMWLASISDYPEELLAFLNNVLDINPDNARAIAWHAATRSLLAKTLVHRAVTAHSAGSHQLATQCLDQATSLDEQCEMAWYWKASRTDDDQEKIKFLERVMSINPENSDARDTLVALTISLAQAAILDAKSSAVAGNTNNALQILEDVLKSNPNAVEAWILKSHLSSSIEEKLDSLKKALAIEPENMSARSGFDFLTATIGSIKTAAEPCIESLSDSTLRSQSVTVDVVEKALADGGDPIGPDTPAVEISNDGALTTDMTSDTSATGIVSLEEPGDLIEGLAVFDPAMNGALGTSPSSIMTDPVVIKTGSECPFCAVANDTQAFECGSCHATLTLSDIESVLSNPRADRQIIQQAITQMEAEWNFREFDEGELTALGIGHLNLRNYEGGYKYLQEASRLSPNNVILSSQLNAIAIRINEMPRQRDCGAPVSSGRTILVVDDSATIRKLISGKLEKAGHTVICAADGVEALARIAESLPDLILLDITMPRMDGYEVCKNIRSNPAAKDVPVVMISGKDGFFDKVRGRMAGTSGYVTKPFGPETLMKALETYLVPDEPESF